jgi:hypothetical protein
LLLIVAWCLLLVLCWPLAAAVFVLWPIIWLLSLPIRILSIVVDALFALIKALLLLPSRLLRGRHTSIGRGT